MFILKNCDFFPQSQWGPVLLNCLNYEICCVKWVSFIIVVHFVYTCTCMYMMNDMKYWRKKNILKISHHLAKRNEAFQDIVIWKEYCQCQMHSCLVKVSNLILWLLRIMSIIFDNACAKYSLSSCIFDANSIEWGIPYLHEGKDCKYIFKWYFIHWMVIKGTHQICLLNLSTKFRVKVFGFCFLVCIDS